MSRTKADISQLLSFQRRQELSWWKRILPRSVCHALCYNISPSLDVETDSSYIQISILASGGNCQKHRIQQLGIGLCQIITETAKKCLILPAKCQKTQLFLTDMKLLGISVRVKAPGNQFHNSFGWCCMYPGNKCNPQNQHVLPAGACQCPPSSWKP